MHNPTELIEDIRCGRMVILVDDEDRENEGDLVLGADFVTPQAINFMAKEARGLICLSLDPDHTRRLGLPQMVGENSNFSPNKTAFTVSIEAARGVSTGISAADRAHTIRVASNPAARPEDIIMPGHVFPIRAQEGGVLKRAGHTEASVDLARMAGLNPAAVICEIMKDDGSMARLPDLKVFAEQFNLKIGTIESLIRYRLETETLVEKVSEAAFPHPFSNDFKIKVFRNRLDGSENIVIQKGEIDSEQPTLVRVQVEDVFEDVFHGGGPQKGSRALSTLNHLASVEAGVLIYLRKEGQHSLIANRVNNMSGQSQKKVMDRKEYGIGAQILRSLGVQRVKLLANSPPKVGGVRGFGLEIEEVVSYKNIEIEAFQGSRPPLQ